MLELLEGIRKNRARSGPHRERIAVALEDIADRLELIAAMVAVVGEGQKPIVAVSSTDIREPQ
jgi:hypothetical protein